MSSWVTLIVLLVLALVGLVLGVVFGLARMLLRPPRMNDGKAMYLLGRIDPDDLGLPFEPFRVHTRAPAPIDLVGWWIPAPTPSVRTAVLIHGYGDAKVGALAWAPVWRSLGFHVLLIDLRAHGESGGRDSTAGFYERDDLDAAIDAIRSARPTSTRQLVLFGVSLGGAVALACAARREDLAGVVVDGVFADYPTAVAVHGRLMRAPLVSLLPITTRLAERLSGARFDAVRPVDSIAACPCPVMLIHGQLDAFVDVTSRERLAAALRDRRNDRDVDWTVPDAGHAMPLAADAAGYRARLADFVARL